MPTPDSKPKGGLALMLGMKPDAASESYITPPKGFQPPDDVADGDAFSINARVRMKDGKLCVEAVNDIPMTGSEDGESAADESSESPEMEKNESELGMEKRPEPNDMPEDMKRGMALKAAMGRMK